MKRSPPSSLAYFKPGLTAAHEEDKKDRQAKIDLWDKRVAGFKSHDLWYLYVGGKPGSLSCDAPPEILEKHGYLPICSHRGLQLGAEIAGMTMSAYREARPEYFKFQELEKKYKGFGNVPPEAWPERLRGLQSVLLGTPN